MNATRPSRSARYNLVLRPPSQDKDLLEDTIPITRMARGSKAPPAEHRGDRRTQRVGEHELEIQRDGDVVTIALAGALRLRGRPDQIRALAATLLAAIDD